MTDYRKKIIQSGAVNSYEDFVRENVVRTNKRLNSVLWACIAAGPAIALCVRVGVFHAVRYTTCLNAAIFMLVLAAIHLFMLKRYPTSNATGLVALFAVDGLLIYMAYAHIGIYLTWILVPMMSLLFCNRRIFVGASLINFACMLLSLWLVAPYYAELRIDYPTAMSYFATRACAYTIEGIVMFTAGNNLSRSSIRYYRELIEKFQTIHARETQMKEQMDILSSMAEIYDNVNLFDFARMTEMSLREVELHEITVMPGQTHTQMNQGLTKYVAPDQMEEFLHFTDVTTLQERLNGKKIIYGEFLHVISGWFRAQYITVESDENGVPQKVIYTTQNIDAEKQREEHLLRISMTDELTRLYNRHCYEEDAEAHAREGLGENFVLFSVDVNGLKETNDSKGHVAGDELLRGTADCLKEIMVPYGKVYRTGGDEFLAMLRADDCEALCAKLKEKAAAWRGMYSDKLSFSVGYARHTDEPNASIHELERIADGMMYAEKERYYAHEGVDRRRRRTDAESRA